MRCVRNCAVLLGVSLVLAGGIVGCSDALHRAALNGDEKQVQQLLKSGHRIDESDKHNDSPLHVAARQGNVNAINILCRNGAKTDVRDGSMVPAIDTRATPSTPRLG